MVSEKLLRYYWFFNWNNKWEIVEAFNQIDGTHILLRHGSDEEIMVDDEIKRRIFPSSEQHPSWSPA
jgi:hypothetical protein